MQLEPRRLITLLLTPTHTCRSYRRASSRRRRTESSDAILLSEESEELSARVSNNEESSSAPIDTSSAIETNKPISDVPTIRLDGKEELDDAEELQTGRETLENEIVISRR